MSTLLKILVALGVTLPLAAFVAGSLVAASDPSPPRERIVIQDDGADEGADEGADDDHRPPKSRKSADDAGERDDDTSLVNDDTGGRDRADDTSGAGDDGGDDDGNDDRNDDRDDHRDDDNGDDDRDDDSGDDDD